MPLLLHARIRPRRPRFGTTVIAYAFTTLLLVAMVDLFSIANALPLQISRIVSDLIHLSA